MTQLVPTFPAPTPSSHLGGLLALLDGGPKALPLRKVQVRAELMGPIAQCRIEQVYQNDLDQILELEHILPLPPDAAVHAFSLKAGDLEIHGLCKERVEAQADYEQAKSSGHRTAIIEQEREDVHRIRVANIPPGSEVRVVLELTWPLVWEGGVQRFSFPTTIAERYLPGTATGHSGGGILPDTDRVPDASKLQPPVLLGGGAALDLQVLIKGMPSLLEVAQHSVSMKLDDGVTLKPSGAALDRDFVLRFSLAAAQKPGLQAWTDGSFTLAQIAPPSESFPEPLPRDASFIVDISGSMRGQKMHAAKLALRTALRGLDVQDRFRILAFDDRLEPYAQGAFLPITEQALAQAEAWIEGLQARGGTEMLPALKMGLAPPAEPGRLHTVLFVTDGQAWNTQELSAAVHHRRGQARLFTLGIDTAVNEALLQQLARLGGGTCTLCAPREDIEAKVADLEARFGAPLLSELRAAGSLGASELFGDQPAMLWIEGAPETLDVQGVSPSGPLKLSAKPMQVADLGPAFAKAQIRRLEDRLVAYPHEEEALKPAILKLSLAHGVLCSQSAFVLVDPSLQVVGPKTHIQQPAMPELEEAFAGGGALPLSAPMAMPRGVAKGRPGPSAPPKAKKAQPKRVGVRRQRSRALPPGLGAPPPMAPAPVSASMVDSEAAELASPERIGLTPLVALVQSQHVDGSWGSIESTLAAFLALLLLGHTRRSGTRRRAVVKAAKWLSRQSDARALQALAWLAQAEGAGLTAQAEMKDWVVPGAEGDFLKIQLAQIS